MAENALARELSSRGARVYIIRLPSLSEGGKTGLDDFLVAKGDEALVALLTDAEEWDLSKELFAFNSEVVFVFNPGVIVKLDNGQEMNYREFTGAHYNDRIFHSKLPLGDGKTKTVEKPLAKAWLAWPMRSVVSSMTYAPGEERFTRGMLNNWPGWGTEEKEGAVKPWNELLDYLFDGEPDSRRWFEQWLSYPLRYPGTKLATAVVVWGIAQGTGKTLVGETMSRIYGENYIAIADKDLHGSFNGWAVNKQFIVGDEIAGGEKKRDVADRMKSMITQTRININRKYMPHYTLPDCINYYFTSNHPDAFFMEDRDRRFMIHEVLARHPLPRVFYDSYVEWLDNGGAAALFYYFRNVVSLDGFNPKAEAPLTNSRREMVEIGRSDLGGWVSDLRERPESVLVAAGKPLPYKLFSTTELLSLYDPDGSRRVSKQGLSRALTAAGFRKVYRGMPVLVQSGAEKVQKKLWAIRDEERLLKIDNHAKLAEIYEQEREGNTGKKKGGKF
jgi:hypothetical protein